MALLGKKVYGRLEEGMYTTRLVKFEEVSGVSKKNKGEAYEYVSFEAVLNGDRPLKFNQFERGLNIMLTQLREQLFPELGNDAAVDDVVILKAAMETDVKMWIQYHVKDDQRYRNIYFAEPTENNAVASEDDTEAIE